MHGEERWNDPVASAEDDVGDPTVDLAPSTKGERLVRRSAIEVVPSQTHGRPRQPTFPREQVGEVSEGDSHRFQ